MHTHLEGRDDARGLIKAVGLCKGHEEVECRLRQSPALRDLRHRLCNVARVGRGSRLVSSWLVFKDLLCHYLSFSITYCGTSHVRSHAASVAHFEELYTTERVHSHKTVVVGTVGDEARCVRAKGRKRWHENASIPFVRGSHWSCFFTQRMWSRERGQNQQYHHPHPRT